MAIPRRVSGSISPIGSQNQAPLAAYALTRSRKQRNQLALTNLPLVKQLARRESQRTAVPMEDLEQSGYLGLIKALEAFDPARSTALSSFSAAPGSSTPARHKRTWLPRPNGKAKRRLGTASSMFPLATPLPVRGRMP